MAKPSATTFVVGYSVILLVLFVTFSVLMSNVNPDRMFFEDEVPSSTVAPEVTDADIPPREVVTASSTTSLAEELLHYRRSNAKDNFTDLVQDNHTDAVTPKEKLAKERRSLKDPSSVLDKLGIVVLEVIDEEGQPRIEIMFHPKRSLMKKTKKNRGDNDIKNSFSAYGKAMTHKGLVNELTDNSVIKIMPDNTIILENSNILVSEEKIEHNSSVKVPSTDAEIGLFPIDNLDVINSMVDSVITAVNDKSPKELASSQADVTLDIKYEKQVDDIETTTDATSELTTNIYDVFESVDIESSKTSYLPETVNLDAFESNGSIITTFSYNIETIHKTEKYNNTETTNADNFDVNDTITTGLISELDISSLTNKQIPEDNYATETRHDITYEVINSNNATTEVINYEISDTSTSTTVVESVKNVDVGDATNFEFTSIMEPLVDADIVDRHETSDGRITKLRDTFETTEESLPFKAKYLLEIPYGETFDTNDRISSVHTTTKVEKIIKATTDANIFKAVVEAIFNQVTSEVTLQNTETSLNANVSTQIYN